MTLRVCARVAEEDAFHSLSGWQACSHLTAEHTVGGVEAGLRVRVSISSGSHCSELHTHTHMHVLQNLICAHYITQPGYTVFFFTIPLLLFLATKLTTNVTQNSQPMTKMHIFQNFNPFVSIAWIQYTYNLDHLFIQHRSPVQYDTT